MNIIVTLEDGKIQKIDAWHIIDGLWTHIVQILRPDGLYDYYTNGKKEEHKHDLH